MPKKLKNFSRQMLIYGLILLLGLPLGLGAMFSSVKKAAAAPEKTVPAQSPITSKIVLNEQPSGEADFVSGKPGAVTPRSRVQIAVDSAFAGIVAETIAGEDGSFEPVLLGDNASPQFSLRTISSGKAGKGIILVNDILPPRLLKSDAISGSYAVGQKIEANFAFSPEKNGLTVWAQVGALDPAFPDKIDLVNVRDEVWQLSTPLLTVRANGGTHLVAIFAKDRAGNVWQKETMVMIALPARAVIVEKKASTQQVVSPRITPQAASIVALGKMSAVSSVEPPKVQPNSSPSSVAEVPKTGGWSKILVALSILIIAAGAAIGGYYGYEWLINRAHSEEPPGPASGSRW